jgi:hypothetical protein
MHAAVPRIYMVTTIDGFGKSICTNDILAYFKNIHIYKKIVYTIAYNI